MVAFSRFDAADQVRQHQDVSIPSHAVSEWPLHPLDAINPAESRMNGQLVAHRHQLP